MPKLEPKQIQKELEKGTLWPVYWLYGTERMKSRELLKRIRKTVLGESSTALFSEDQLDATEVSAAEICDRAQSLSLGGGTRLLVIREAHAIKDSEVLETLMGPSANSGLTSVCVFLSKDLDARKKFSKKLIEKAAVVPCDAVAEEEREAWIDYLAKRRGLVLDAAVIAQLRSMDPWSLDLLDLELDKFELSEKSADVLLGSSGVQGGSDVFFEAFFSKDLKKALEIAEGFADKTEESLPLLGLFSWNVRYLFLVIAEKQSGSRELKLNPYLAEKLNRWSKNWSLPELLALQEKLHELDYTLKQTPKHPLGAWSDLMIHFT